MRGLVSPHIDYERGGPVYGAVWAPAKSAALAADLDIIFGTDHSGGHGKLTLTRQHYATPFGILPTATAIVEACAAAVSAPFEEELHHRIREKIPMPNSEAIIRRVIAEHLRGEPDFDSMAPALAELARQQREIIQADLARAGDLKDISFKGVSQAGWDVYDVRFANANMEWSFILGADAKISGLYLKPSP